MTISPLPTQSTQGAVAANLICMASMLIWSAGLPAADLLIPHLPPLILTALRIGISALFLLPVWVALDGWATLREANWRAGLFVGGLGFSTGACLLIFAQSRTDAVTVAVISATMPVIGIGLERLYDGRKLTVWVTLGMGLSLVGGVLAFVGQFGSDGIGIGALAAFGSVFAFTWGSRATVKRFPDLSPVGRTTITLAGAGVISTLAALLTLPLGAPTGDFAALGWPEYRAMALYSVGALAISQLLWIVAVGRLGIGVASFHINATPFYVMLFLFVLGGIWNQTQALGAVIVVLGVMIAQYRPAR